MKGIEIANYIAEREAKRMAMADHRIENEIENELNEIENKQVFAKYQKEELI